MPGCPTTFSLTVFTPKNRCRKLTLSEARFYLENGRFCVFHTLLGLGATYDVYLRLIRKRVVDFLLLVLIELVLLSATSEAHTREYGLKVGDFASTGPIDPKFPVEDVVSHKPFFFSEN